MISPRFARKGSIAPRFARILMAATSLLAATGPLTAGCGAREAPPAPAVELLPPGDALPPDLDGMLYGSAKACRVDEECPGRVCYYGACMGLLIIDQRWMQEALVEALVTATEGRPGLRGRVRDHLARVVDRTDTDLAYRARALLGLEALGEAAPLRAALEAGPEALQVAAALALCRLGDAAGVPLAAATTEADAPALAAEALQALGRSGSPDALEPLLRTLNPELDATLLGAALGGLEALADPRAARPLVAFLDAAPGYLHHRAVRTLRAVTGARLGDDAAAWRAWVAAARPPAPPPYTLRAFSPEEELGLPTP